MSLSDTVNCQLINGISFWWVLESWVFFCLRPIFLCVLKAFVRVNLATRTFLSIICLLQICVLSTAVVSPSFHLLVFHNQYTENVTQSGTLCSEHNHGNSTENDSTPNNEQHCPVIEFSQGLTLPDACVPENWVYVDYHSVLFTEPESLVSSFCSRLASQRAPPLV